jgi:hypothetical protein
MWIVRRFFTVVKVATALLSLFICVGLLALWPRSYHTSDKLRFIRSPSSSTAYFWQTARGQLLFTRYFEEGQWKDSKHFGFRYSSDPATRVISLWNPDRERHEQVWRFLGAGGSVHLWPEESARSVHMIIPLWMLALVAGAYWPWYAIGLAARIRRSRRRRQARCEQCGYDLRASAGRCPECGTPIPPAASAAKPEPAGSIAPPAP